jgi:23S rRNA (pseudouridine1915-N3)-methyltransferase
MIVSIPEITIVCVGAVKDRNILSLVEMYCSRLSHEARVRINEIKDGTPETEGERIIPYFSKPGGYSFALTEEGNTYTSRQFAARLESITGKMMFIIGGATGLSTKVKSRADELLSLSPLTFTHEIARFLLLEQLYRACSIMHNRNYHKG